MSISDKAPTNSETKNESTLVPKMIHYNFLAMLIVAFFVGTLVSFMSKFVTPVPESASAPWTVMLIACVAAFVMTTGLSILLESRNRKIRAAAELRIAGIIESKYGWKIDPREIFRTTMDNQIEIPYRRIRAIMKDGRTEFVILSLSSDGKEIQAYRDPIQ